MSPFRAVLWLTLIYLARHTSARPDEPPEFDAWSYKKDQIIDRDVAIIGGGSAGIYSAISLKDKGKSVIVVERKARIGGHTETYTDPVSGMPIDIGVIVWHDTPIVRAYFERLNVPLIKAGSDIDPSAPPPRSGDYDFRTGQSVNITPLSPEAVGAAFAGYTQQILKYPRLSDGMFLPNPVPDDLVMPFGEFVQKYNLEAVLPTMFQYDPGLGDILTVPTVEIMRYFGLSLVQQLQTGGFLTTQRHNNSELYANAQAELLSTSSLLLSSEVQLALRPSRNTPPVHLVVRTPSGRRLIRAKKLLITIPPKLDFLGPFAPNDEELSVFGRLIKGGYCTSVVKNTGISDDLSVLNRKQDTPYHFPELPAVYEIQRSPAPGLHIAFYGTPRSTLSQPVPDSQVQSDIIAGIKQLQAANPETFNQTEPEFVEFSSHLPFYVQFAPEDTRNGYYGKMYALQGKRNTFWTGASWRTQDSSEIWRFTEQEVLPGLLAALG
ncbi:amine oxidase, flavin-containing superfamily [Westerdykella ornata]|uniref:Amine oxidase, flavin-containing superfamily n=1 Tax=Westerdykella ornata TaxID=318751 RepID=A0A6A6JCH6_WESOR|nr:amine oxidase, flavin-containing superfamily [Westerdykella ornata]KAF2274132.1 amine oxidase, flavin-containing superfamily [Westerdykella ornata]